MVAGDAAGPLAGRGHRRHGERGGVRGEDAVLLDALFEAREERALRLQVLDDRFDHDVARREGVERVDRLDPPDDAVGVRGGQAAFLGQSSERLGDRFARFARRAGLGVVDEGAGAALREDLGNATAHRAGPGHAGHEVAAVGI